MNVGIVGAGGIGSYYAGQLSRIGIPVRLIARGEHLAAINAHGLEVRTPEGAFNATPEATSDVGQLAGSDYVIVAVKGYSLDEVGATLAEAAHAGAAIVPLLNGVDVAERLEALGVPRASIIGGLARASLVRSAPGVVERRSSFDRVSLGELDRVKRERTAQLVAALADTGVDAEVSDDISLELWRKFAFIVPMTVGCGLSRQPAGRVLDSERGRTLVTRALREIVEVSRVTGSPLSDEDEASVSAELLALPEGMRPSFLIDLERGGPVELDLLAGAVCRLGQAAGVPTPVHDVAAAAFDIATRPASWLADHALSGPGPS